MIEAVDSESLSSAQHRRLRTAVAAAQCRHGERQPSAAGCGAHAHAHKVVVRRGEEDRRCVAAQRRDAPGASAGAIVVSGIKNLPPRTSFVWSTNTGKNKTYMESSNQRFN